MKKTLLAISFGTALGSALLFGCSKSKVSQNQTQPNATAQSGRRASSDEIRKTSVAEWFDRIGDAEIALGLARNTSANALVQKARESESTKDEIIRTANSIVDDPKEGSYKRWQSCYILAYIGDRSGIPAIQRALKVDDVTIRGVAACALGRFNDAEVHDSLAAAAKGEKDPNVQAWIQKALAGQFLANK